MIRPGGVHFSVCSRHATRVELCLYDPADPQREIGRMDLARGERDTWSVEVPGVGVGALYGYRVHGDHHPALGHRFEASKLLVDPWARATTGPHRWHPSHQRGAGDSAAASPRAVVVDTPTPPTQPPLRTPWADTVLYEAHVKGMTARHPDVPPAQRGRFLGLTSEPLLEHFARLGVTAVQLLPVHQGWDEAHLVRRGLTNYWGYGPLAYFAPDGRYASGSRGEQVVEFRQMVDALHAAGIEVLLDVVFNHTAEGNDDGPVLSLRGLDNAAYYRLHPSDPARAVDWTGCGNTLDADEPLVHRLILDCLRWWVRDLGVDGFRFDLGATLHRSPGLLADLAADPILGQVKLIAEPWDLGPDGYRLGRFPAPWREWNDRFRDTARKAWRGDPGLLPELATRLAGSSDVFAAERGPRAGINYVACHDGFTLTDLTTWRHKRNAANGEENRDGSDSNHAEPWGPEGPTDDPGVLALRAQAARNLLATVAVAQGVPMLAHGDAIGRTQGGNNNAYCQDGPTTWLDWDHVDRERLEFVRSAFAVRRRFAALRRGRFLADDDATWLEPTGERLSGDAWRRVPAMGLLLGSDLLLLLNPSGRDVAFALPPASGAAWRGVLDTAAAPSRIAGASVQLSARSILLLTCGAG